MSGLWATITSTSVRRQRAATSFRTSPSFDRILDDAGRRGHVRMGRLLEVEREPRIALEVQDPGPRAIGARHATDVEPPVERMQGDLDPTRLTRPATGRGHVDELRACERIEGAVVHGLCSRDDS